MANFTPEQIKDIQEREKKCLDFIREQEMTPAAMIQKIKVGNDVFADKVIPFLNDTKYADKNGAVESPIQKDDISKTS